MGAGTGRRRIAIVGAASLALLAAVGLATRAHAPAGGAGHARGINTDILLEYALVLTAAAALVVVPVAVYVFVMGHRKEAVALPPRGNWMAALFVTTTALAVAALLFLGSHYLRRHHGHSGLSPSQPVLTTAGKSRAPRAVRFDWVPVIVVASLMAAALAAAAVAVARRREPSRPRLLAEQIATALEETLSDLRAEPDPRRAVIAAYAQMEHALARAGLPRAASEAPREYLRRVLPGLGAGAGSVERLTALFERAKFSPHAIDGAMKDEAITALETLRDELRGAG